MGRFCEEAVGIIAEILFDPVCHAARCAADAATRSRTYPFGCSGCGRQITHRAASPHKEDGLGHAGHGLCEACYSQYRKLRKAIAGKPDLRPADLRHKPCPASFKPRPCTSCNRTIARGSNSPGTGLSHGGHGLCRTCATEWNRQGGYDLCPPEQFVHQPRTNRASSKNRCVRCGRQEHEYRDGMCRWCADGPERTRRTLPFPFPCSSCGTIITHGSKGKGNGACHGTAGLRKGCARAWREAGSPTPVAAFSR